MWVEDAATGLSKRIQVSGRTKAETSARLRSMRDRLEDGQGARDHVMTFGTFAAAWLESGLAASDRRASTKALYMSLTRNHVVDSKLGRTPLRSLRPSTVEQFVARLRAKGLSSSSVRQIYTVGRAIGDAAVADGLLGRNPFAAVRRPRVTRMEAAYLTPAQVRLLLEAAGGSRYRLLFEFLVHTGLRRGEALALSWRDVDLAARTLRVRGTLTRLDGELRVTDPKSSKSRRTIPLSEPALAVVREVRARTTAERRLAEDLWMETGFVFVTDLGEPCDPRNALRALTVAARAAGLPRVGLHTLRHSAASVMLSHGVPIAVVSQVLGHSGISITVDVYGHVAPDVSREALAVLGSVLSGPIDPADSDAPAVDGRASTDLDGDGRDDDKYVHKYVTPKNGPSR